MVAERLIAHRGWQRRFPENTLPALRGAIEAGARRLEFDVQLDAEGHPWLCHDPTLQRLCNDPRDICELPGSVLAGLSAHEPERFGRRFLGTPLARLADAVALLQAHPEVTAYCELKRHSLRRHGAEAMLAAVRPLLAPLADRCVLISFDLPVLQSARRQGWPRIGAVLEHWEQRHDPALAALAPELVFADLRLLPRPLPPLPWPLAIYEVDAADTAAALLAEGAACIETFAIGELLQTVKEAVDVR